MLEGVADSTFAQYVSSSSGANEFMKQGNAWFSRLDDGFFKLAQYTTALIRQIAQQKGDTELVKKLEPVEAGFDVGRMAVCSTRFVFPVHKMATGQTFFTQGWRKVAHHQPDPDGPRIPMPFEWGLNWEKDDNGIWRNKETGQFSADGKYVDDPMNGEYMKRDWMDVLMDILVIVARIITPIRWLHALGAIKLGEHAAKALRGVSMGLWGAILSIGLVQSLRDLVTNTDAEKVRQMAWGAIQGGVDLIALIFDFGFGSAHPALAITGSIFNIASAGSKLASEAVYY